MPLRRMFTVSVVGGLGAFRDIFANMEYLGAWRLLFPSLPAYQGKFSFFPFTFRDSCIFAVVRVVALRFFDSLSTVRTFLYG
jgi:hypothetical protein